MLLSPYQTNEVAGLVDTWAEIQPHRAKPFFMVRLLDLDVAFSKLSLDERRAVFCLGFAQLTSREAAEVLDVHPSTVVRRFQRGLAKITAFVNGREYPE